MNYEALTIKPKVFETIFALCLLAMFFLIVSFLWIPIGIHTIFICVILLYNLILLYNFTKIIRS